MIVTHRVKDSNNKPIGFIASGNIFYSDFYIENNIEYIENVTITRNGTLRYKKQLPVIYYKDVMKLAYTKLVRNNPFSRDIQIELSKWRNRGVHKVLQLEGSRQTGKTTEILKFAYSNYEYVIYITLSADVYNFERVLLEKGIDPLAMEIYCVNAGLPRYVDSKNTLIIIDEIQISSQLYNRIREFNSKLNCDLVVTGSYIGQTLKKEFFQPAGTIEYAYMLPLSFKEMCRIFKEEKTLDTIDLFGESPADSYDRLNKLYEVYKQIGGYPEVLKTFLSTKNIGECHNVIKGLLTTFEKESRNYFNDPRDTLIFNTVYTEAMKEMCLEKRGTEGKYIDTVVKIANQARNQKTLVSREEVVRATEWLVYSGIVGVCHLYIDGNIKNKAASRRTYYIDCGIANYIARSAHITDGNREGLLTETFAYSELYRLCKMAYSDTIINEEVPCFSVYGAYELDFMIVDKANKSYGIEVKTNTGDPKSLKVYIDKGLVDRGIVCKNTKGGHGDKFDSIPIYTIGARFPYK